MPKPMTPKQIRIALLEADVSMADIARKLNVSRPAISMVARNKSVSARIRAAIADAISQPVDAIWPPAACGKKKRGRITT